MTYENISFEVNDGVGLLRFARPAAMNAINIPLLNEFNAALDAGLEAAEPMRCLLITGEGKGFCSGADLAAAGGGLTASTGGKLDVGSVLQGYYNPLVERLMALPVPIVTAVNGPAAGAGCSFAILGDIVVASSSAYFLQAFVNIGLVPDVASTWLLPRLVGKQRAAAMMMLGERIPAAKALDWGLVYEVVEPDALMPRATEIATRLASGPTAALTLIRTGLRRAMEESLSQTLWMERVNQQQAGNSADFREGVAAFLEKRKASFKGH